MDIYNHNRWIVNGHHLMLNSTGRTWMEIYDHDRWDSAWTYIIITGG